MRNYWVLFTLLLVIAMFTRFWQLDNFDISPDEYHFISDAFRRFNDDPYMNARHHPFRHGVPFIGHPFFAQDLMLISFRLFGPSVWAGRAVMAGASVLTIIGVYVLGRLWLGATAGLLAMGLLLVLPLDVRYARDAHIDTVLAATLTWAGIFLFLTIKQKKWYWAMLWGMVSAFAFTTKINGPVLFFYYGLFFFFYAIRFGVRHFFRLYTGLIVVGAVAFGVVTFLLVDPASYVDALVHPADPEARTSIPWFFQGGWYHFVWMHLIRDFYTPLFAIIVFFGVIVAVRKRTIGMLILLAWTVAYSHIFLTHNGHSGPYGYMPLNPPFVLLGTSVLMSMRMRLCMVVTFTLLIFLFPFFVGNGLRLSAGPFQPTTLFFDSNFLQGQTPYRDAAHFLNKQEPDRFTVLWIKDGDRHFPHMELRDGIFVTPFATMEEALYGLTADPDWKGYFEKAGFSLVQTFSFRNDRLYLLRRGA